MMMVFAETGQTVRSFVATMKEQPLALALVVMNFVLLGYLFYSGHAYTTQRNETVKLIVDWQKGSDLLMANCVSKDIMELVLKSVERDRELYRALLPKLPSGETPPTTDGPKLQSDESTPVDIEPKPPEGDNK